MVPVVAIDGPVGVGKSTVAAAVADELQFRHIDTGAMYRCVALKVLRQTGGNDPTEVQLAALGAQVHIELPGSGLVLCDGEDVSQAIRDESVSRFVSRVADVRPIREALVREQQRLGRQAPSVLEGRDIGTVVFPDAACKIYLDGAPMVRARRRLAQLESMGKQADLDDIYKALLERDARDRSRPWGALSIAPGACVLDTTRFSQDHVVQLISQMVRGNPAFSSLAGAR